MQGSINNIKEIEKPYLVKLATYASISVAFIIIIAKIVGWFLTDSLSILASLVDSFLDIAASFINLLAVRYALQPPDNEHRFGHGKAEDLAVFTQSSFFALSGLFIAIASIKRFFIPEVVLKGKIGILIMVFSVVITSLLLIFQKYVIRKTKSNVIEADYFHYFVDLLTNLATIISLVIVTYYDYQYADPIFAIVISMYVLYGAWKLFMKAFNNLMDHEFNNKEKEIIIKIIKSETRVIGFHDLRTRYSGSNPFIQFHLEMDGNITLNEAHEIAENVEKKIKKVMPDAGVIIHQDPYDIEEMVSYKD